ncbi:DsbA family protein [uncultured Brevundimonas sp.]|uniref:DsbA family protein n=1 Tax=uncultured Brevundimonas sp. TaxID=213418 RepID=UPI002635622B|nr:DsbA family protein [uncultured Brevundimonas sp.]
MGGRFKLGGIVVASLLAFAPAVGAEDMSSGSPTLSGSARSATPRAAAIPDHLSSDRVMGRADAPITIIEYASFTCSHCATFANEVLPTIKREFIDTGKAKLIFRDLPTPPVQVSNTAAGIGRCAAPDRFFDVANYLMREQSEAFASRNIEQWLVGSIAVSGRTTEEVIECMRRPQITQTLLEDVASASAAGVNSTPAVFVNGRRVQDHSLAGLRAALQPLVR